MTKRISKFLSILLVICMVASMVPATAFAATTPSKLYLQPNSNWLVDGARFAAYYFNNSTNSNTWVSATALGDGYYEVTVPSGYPNVIFCRMNPSASANNWNNKWNQTADLTIPTDGTNCYTVAAGTWDNGGGTWSTYTVAPVETDPVETEPAVVDYYLIGYINGANYGCEEDYENLGEYKFEDGKLVATFDVDSYVFVKTGDNASWYMAESYCTDTTVTLIKGESEKLLVPGGVEITFTLVENADGTLTLSYETAECVHDYVAKVTTAATCTTESVTTYTCSKCGDSYTVTGAALGHNYASEVTTAATCTESGVLTYTCANCGDTYTEQINPNGHSYSNGKCTVCGIADPNCDHSYTSKVTTEPTCLGTGEKLYTCTKCGDVYTEEIPANGHDYTLTVVAPTCENNGYTIHACKNCSYTYNDTPVNPIGHNYSSVVTEPTCTEGGYTTYTCANCGNVYTWNKTAALGHSYVGGSCTTCGAVDESYNPDYYLVGYINGADYGCEEDYENLGEYKFEGGKLVATFDADSYVFIKTGDNAHWYLAESYCTDTTVTLIENETEKLFVPGNREITFTLNVNADGTLTLSYVAAECDHNYTAEVTTAATCTTDGVTTYTCTKCGDSYTVTIAAAGHNYASKVTTAATCTESGVLTYTCANCGDTYTEQINPNGHSYSNGKCTVCGTADPNCDHSYTSKVTTEPTCLGTGEKLYTCTKCGDVYTEEIPANGHDYELTVVAPTCENNGYTIHACKNCSYSYNDTPVNPIGHNYSSVVTEPTCTEGGYTTYTCANCGNVYTWNETAALGHSYVGGSCTTCGAAEEGYAPDYYLVGYINGADYGCEGDYENLGEYKFVDGTLVATFEADSYVFIKTGDNANWYLAEAFCTDTTVTLVKNASEKLFVPGGREITFTLVVNADGTLTLSYVASEPEHTHIYVASVTEPTCTEAGYTTYTCECGDSYTANEIEATGHSYSGGVCTVCGASDPDYVYIKYYLFGYINDTDYGQYDDAESTGYFRLHPSGELNTFSNTFNFTSDSYVGVKTGDNTKWYLTNGWQGEVTSVTLYDSTLLGTNADKLLIPGGYKVMVTLVTNSDGTMTLSYELLESLTPAVCEHPSHDQNGYCTVCHEVMEHTYVDGVCTVCGLTQTTEHTHSYEAVVTAPTCTEGGYTTYTCECGDSYIADETAALGHSYEAIVTAPTCETEGYTTYTCSCGDSYVADQVAALGHSYVDGSCTNCGAEDPDYVEPTEPVEGGYVLVTDIADITAGGQFVIVANNSGSYKALGTTISSKISVVDVTVSGNVVTGDSLPVWTIEATSGGVALSVDGTYLSYKSSTNFTSATSAYEWGVTAGSNGGFIFNSTAATRGIYYQKTGDRFGAYSTIYVNSSSYVAELLVFKYVEGTTEPEEPVVNDYYLVGYINGADYGCEDDYENLGEYKFVDGTLVATFEADSYVFIKTGDNAHWYLAEAFCTDTTVTLIENETEKLFVPGGVEITFSLVENADGTLTLSYVADEPEHTHSYTAEVTTEPTCLGEGVTTYTCECGDSYTETIAATGHDYEITVVEPTCENNGYTIHACKNCSYSYNDTPVNPIGHNYSSVVTEPTCTEGGYTTYTCANCGHVYTWNETAALGHTYVGGSCTTCGAAEDGYAPDYYLVGYINGADYGCEDDYENLGEYKFVNGTLVATFEADSYVFIKTGDNAHWYLAESFCTDTTVTLIENESEKLFVPGSVEITFTLVVNADGTLTLSYVADEPEHTHSYTAEVTTEPTCLGEGVTTYTCECGDSYTETIAATGHDYEITVVDPTCENNGYTIHACKNCSYSYNDTPVNPIGHNYSSVVTEPTCTEGGYTTYTCANCGHVYTWDETAALGHNYVGGSCTTCGAAEDGYAPDYYLVGYINGADYGCEDDYENLGEYKFVNGTLVATFEADSYVFIKTGDNAHWYLAEAFCTDTTVTLIENESEKLFVPGGVEITFTLVENADGTLTLNYVVAEQPHEHSYTATVTAPTCETAGYTTYTCECGDSYVADEVAALGHSYVDGACTVCGAADPDYVPVTVTAKSFSLSFEDEILVNFYYTISDMTDVVDHGMLVFYTDPGTPNYSVADVIYNDAAYDSVKTRYGVTTTGIAAKEMGDTRYYVAYAKLSDGTYVYSTMYDYSPKKYAMNMLGKSSTSDKQKALCVAMLNYGAAAQNYFGYNTDNLMNAELTAEQQALVIAYDASLFTGAVAADSSKIGNFAATSTGFSKKTATVSFEGAFAINYYFTPNATVSGTMTLYCWTPEAYAAADVLTADNASSAVAMVSAGDGRYWADVTGIAAKCLDETYYVAAVYTDAAGNTYCTGVVAYSLSKYCMNNADGTMGELAQATAMYGYYAKQFFTN